MLKVIFETNKFYTRRTNIYRTKFYGIRQKENSRKKISND